VAVGGGTRKREEENMSRAFEIRGKSTYKNRFGPDNAEVTTRLGSLLVEGSECWKKGKWWGSPTVLLYPDAAVPRARLTALEADPSPIKEISEDYARYLPEVLDTLKDFVESHDSPRAYLGLSRRGRTPQRGRSAASTRALERCSRVSGEVKVGRIQIHFWPKEET
jgi:hypothetical protein